MLLLDNSAWSRIVAARLPAKSAAQVAAWIEKRALAACLPFLLEAGFSARSSADYHAMTGQFDLLPRIVVMPGVEERALQAQRQLAAIGHHRLSPVDLMIAACAEEAGGGVLHYDRDYDLIAEHTDLSFESVWVAERGTL